MAKYSNAEMEFIKECGIRENLLPPWEEKESSEKPEQDSMMEELDKAVEKVEAEFKDRIDELKTEEIARSKIDETKLEKEE